MKTVTVTLPFTFSDYLFKLGACDIAIQALQDKLLCEETWNALQVPEWLFWFAVRVGVPPEEFLSCAISLFKYFAVKEQKDYIRYLEGSSIEEICETKEQSNWAAPSFQRSLCLREARQLGAAGGVHETLCLTLNHIRPLGCPKCIGTLSLGHYEWTAANFAHKFWIEYILWYRQNFAAYLSDLESCEVIRKTFTWERLDSLIPKA
jgi:hypothetical protein